MLMVEVEPIGAKGLGASLKHLNQRFAAAAVTGNRVHRHMEVGRHQAGGDQRPQ